MVGCAGSVVHARMPDVMSLSDFTRRRFGLAVHLFVEALILFNMGIALTAEYTAIGVGCF
jgi:hypothetical protein